MDESSKLITIVVGPTASGKSKWALAEALSVGGAIANADSVQIYKHLVIGAAKPGSADLAMVPHHLYDLVTPVERFTAGDYRRAALALIEEKINSQPLFFVGGSGFYIQALEKGMFEVAPISEGTVKAVEEIRLAGGLYDELRIRDEKAAAKIGPTDPYRLQRALELVLSEGRTLEVIRAEFQAKNKPLSETYKIRKLGLSVDRGVLRKRVTARAEQMISAGLIDEVEALLKLGFGETKALKSIGYKEVAAYLSGQLPREQLLSSIITSTMQLAKRQMTWFRRDPEIEWIES